MIINQLVLYTFQVEYTSFVRHEDEWENFSHFQEHPYSRKTVNLLGKEHMLEFMSLWCLERFRWSGIKENSSNPKILSVAQTKIDGYMELHG